VGRERTRQRLGQGWSGGRVVDARPAVRRVGSLPPRRGRERAASTDMDIRVPLAYYKSEAPRWHTLCGNVGGNTGGGPYAALVRPTRTGGTGDVDAQVGVKRA
jgi:hypothetical protein